MLQVQTVQGVGTEFWCSVQADTELGAHFAPFEKPPFSLFVLGSLVRCSTVAGVDSLVSDGTSIGDEHNEATTEQYRGRSLIEPRYLARKGFAVVFFTSQNSGVKISKCLPYLKKGRLYKKEEGNQDEY